VIHTAGLGRLYDVADNQGSLQCSAEQRDELESRAQSRSLCAGDVFRARLILALADGLSYRQIERKLGASAPTVSKWKSRFEQAGMEGLQGQHKGSKPRRATPAVQAHVMRRAQQKPLDGSTHWSCRKLGEQLGVSKSTVQRILAQAKLRPHRLERYMASNDPEFEAKAADIIGLYLNPPQHAAVFCVDEKTAIQALDRLDPVLPLSPGRAERHGFEYYRHGTLSLYAALNVKTGRVEGKTARRHTSAEFVGFLTELVGKSEMGTEDSHRTRQSVGAQNAGGRAVSSGSSQGTASLYSDLLVLVESGRDLVCQNRARRDRAWSIHFGL